MPTYTNIQDFPAGIEILSVNITARNAAGMRLSPVSFFQEVQVFPGQMMEMSVTFNTHFEEMGSLLEGFMLSLRGQAGVFRFFDPAHSVPMGQCLGDPKIIEAVAGSQSIKTKGWFGNIPRQLLAGDYIQLGERLHRVLETIASDERGEAELKLWPNVRETMEEGADVVTYQSTGLFRLSENNFQYGRQAAPYKHNHGGMNIIEAL